MRQLKPPAPGRRELFARLRWIMCYGPKVPVLRHVLQTMAWHDDDQGRDCYAAVDTLAAETALSERTIQYALADLVACGWVAPELPADRPDRYHANPGGRTRSTRYRVIYRDQPTAPEPRRHWRTDKRRKGATVAGTTPPQTPSTPPENPATVAAKGATVAANPATVAPEGRNGCGGSGMIRIDPVVSAGGVPPSPPQDVAAALPLAAGAAVPRPLPRAVIRMEATRTGCWTDGDAGEHWTDLLERIGVAYISEVRSTVFQLRQAAKRDHPDSGLLPPHHVTQVEKYEAEVAAWLLTYRAEVEARAKNTAKSRKTA